MLVNQLLVIPTPETIEYLSKVFSACPFPLNLRDAFVEVNSSQTPMVPDTDRIYKATAGTMRVFYDQSTEQSSLLLPLVSEPLFDRCEELRQEAPSAFYGEYYFPHLVLVRGMPPLARSYRGFISSVATTLATDPNQCLLFDAELVVSRDFHAAPDMDYYTAQIANNNAWN